MGLWKIHAASRRTGPASATGAAAVTVNRGTVSLWVHEFTARGAQRARIVEHLKRGVSALSRLRHPCILEVVEPLEESRTEVMFVTEHVSTTLAAAISPHARPEIQLDEVEIQKGLLQVRLIPDCTSLTAEDGACTRVLARRQPYPHQHHSRHHPSKRQGRLEAGRICLSHLAQR